MPPPCPLRNWFASQFHGAQACSMPTTRTGISKAVGTPLSKRHPCLSMTRISWFIKDLHDLVDLWHSTIRYCGSQVAPVTHLPADA